MILVCVHLCTYEVGDADEETLNEKQCRIQTLSGGGGAGQSSRPLDKGGGGSHKNFYTYQS